MNKIFFSACLFTIFVCFAMVKQSLAQSNLPNLSTINVEDLTDLQIRQLMQKASSLGYSGNNRLEQMAAAQGMSLGNIEKLRQKAERMTNNNAFQTNSQVVNNQRSYNSTDSIDNLQRAKAPNAGLPIFGEDLFSNGNRISFEPNLRMATPKGYIIGPDDELIIDLTGDNEASYTLKVSPEGIIRVQYVGLIQVGGLTIEQAITKIKNSMSSTYPGLKTGKTNIAINLGNPKSIRITILGEAVKPASYTLSSFSTVFNALYLSGGPNKNGSFRNIQLIRNNKLIAEIDVYNFLLKGIQQNNLRLQDQDVINIPVYRTRVGISGEVKRPALYEVAGNETLKDVLDFAGGFSSSAYTADIKVFKNTNKERRLDDVYADRFSNYKPANGDKFIVEKILDRFVNRVDIEGAVSRPGWYELEEGLTLKKLIARADGLNNDAFLNRGYISRLNLDNSLSLISFDLNNIMLGNKSDISLQREDKINISSIFDLKDEYDVEIQGEVRSPGIFKYASNATVADLIEMAGGFKEGATPNRIEIARRVKNSDAKSPAAITAQIFTINVDQDLKMDGVPFILQPYDIVSVRNSEGYQTQKIVRIEGEVLYPGPYIIQRKDERISDVLKRAGGLTGVAFPAGASLRRPERKFTGGKYPADTSKSTKKTDLIRLQQLTGVSDLTSFNRDSTLINNDFVGIDLVKILQKPLSRIDLLLQDGDIINVPKELQTVKVTGEVLKPTNIIYNPGKTMMDYINESGGLSYSANKKGSYLIYPNGSIRSVKRNLFFYIYPDVKPGSEIFVPKHAPRTPLGLGGIIGISSALTSLALIVVTLFRK